MAITKTYLYAGSMLETMRNLYNWLTENAVGKYFDSVTFDETNAEAPITCNVSGNPFVVFRGKHAGYTNTYRFGMYTVLAGGDLVDITGLADQYPQYVVACEHGFYIEPNAEGMTLCVTLDNQGLPCLIYTSALESVTTGSSESFYAISPLTGVVKKQYFYHNTKDSLTSLAPIVPSDCGGAYAKYAFFMQSSQYRSAGTLTIDGVQYLSNGIWCILDEGTPSTGSTTDLTNYYTKSQTDAKITAAVAGVEAQCSTLGTAVSAASLSIKVYVDATSGSDENDGLTSSTAFQTLAKATEIALTYGMVELQLAAGEYQFADVVQQFFHGDIRITGAGQDSTTLYAQVYANHANVEIASLTLDTTHGTSLSAAALTVTHGGTGKLSDAIITTTSNNGVYVGNMGYVWLYNVVINGSTQRMVYVTNDGQATIQTVSGTTDSDRPNVLSGSAALVRIVSSPDLTYSTNYTGIVYVDGVQRSPVDLSTLVTTTAEG